MPPATMPDRGTFLIRNNHRSLQPKKSDNTTPRAGEASPALTLFYATNSKHVFRRWLTVNSGMKTAISLLTELMRNWKAVANTAQYFILPNAAIFALYKYSTASQRVEVAQSAAAAATERRKAAVLQLAVAIEKGSVDDINAANATLQKAKADEVAAQKATTRMGLLKSGAKSIGAGFSIIRRNYGILGNLKLINDKIRLSDSWYCHFKLHLLYTATKPNNQ